MGGGWRREHSGGGMKATKGTKERENVQKKKMSEAQNTTHKCVRRRSRTRGEERKQ